MAEGNDCYLRLRIASRIRANPATRCIISEAMHARVQWKVHRRNVIIIVARFAYATDGRGRGRGWLPHEGRGEREGLKEGEDRPGRTKRGWNKVEKEGEATMTRG